MGEPTGLLRVLPLGRGRQHGPARGFVQPSDGRLRRGPVHARAAAALRQRAGLASVEQNDRLLRLHAVGDPILQVLLADGPAIQRNQIKPAIERIAVPRLVAYVHRVRPTAVAASAKHKAAASSSRATSSWVSTVGSFLRALYPEQRLEKPGLVERYAEEEPQRLHRWPIAMGFALRAGEGLSWLQPSATTSRTCMVLGIHSRFYFNIISKCKRLARLPASP